MIQSAHSVHRASFYFILLTGFEPFVPDIVVDLFKVFLAMRVEQDARKLLTVFLLLFP